MSLARKIFTEFKERDAVTDAELDDFWATLEPATIDGIIGEWKGGEFVTGHLMNGQLFQMKSDQLVQLMNGQFFQMRSGELVHLMNGQVFQMNGQMIHLMNGQFFQMNGQLANMMNGQLQMGMRQ